MYQKYTDFGRQKGIVTLTPNTVDALTNEEQVKKIQALERGAAESTRLIENLWVQNCGLVKTIVHNVTGLNAGEPGFDDMEQQSFFGFHAAIYTYDPAADIKFSTYVAKRIKWEITVEPFDSWQKNTILPLKHCTTGKRLLFALFAPENTERLLRSFLPARAGKGGQILL